MPVGSLQIVQCTFVLHFADNTSCPFAVVCHGLPVAVLTNDHVYITGISRIFRSDWITCRDVSCTALRE